MEPLSTAIAIGTAAAPWFGEWVTVEIAGALLKGITATVNLDEAIVGYYSCQDTGFREPEHFLIMDR